MDSSKKEPQRIAKWLARAGVASRRGVERLIEARKVQVNGKVLESPAFLVTGAEDIRVEGKKIGPHEPPRLWRYAKPRGLITTTRDPERRPSVFDKLPKELPRVISIGRLDINTEGLLLLTNDGELARQLELPATGWTRRYRVRAFGEVTQERLDKLKDGMRVDGVKYGPITAVLEKKQGDNVWLTMVLREGKNREIKKVLEALGLKVNRLIRTSYGPFTLTGLETGGIVEVPRKILRDQLGPLWSEKLKPPPRRGPAGKKRHAHRRRKP
jgi:23S rRNA pseudouridine2605 synthase